MTTPNADYVAAVIIAARQLVKIVHRDAALGDPHDLGCLQNHGLLWHALEYALDMPPNDGNGTS